MTDSPYAAHPNIARPVEAVVDVWRDHGTYLEKSFGARTASLLDTSDRMAAAVLELAADDDFMKRYMNGLLFSHVLWFMHASSLHFFVQRLAARVKAGGKVLEVGSGHGLLLFLCLRDLKMRKAVAWDLSPVSLEHTRAALARLGAEGRARFAVQDMHQAEATGEQFDLVILSHLLEHLDDPIPALATVKTLLTKDGVLFVNVPLNAPMPDHSQLLRDPSEAEKMLVDGGSRVLEIASHTTQAMPLGKALKRKAARRARSLPGRPERSRRTRIMPVSTRPFVPGERTGTGWRMR